MNNLLFLVASQGQPQAAQALCEVFNKTSKDIDLLFLLDAGDAHLNEYDATDINYILYENSAGGLSEQLIKCANLYADNYDGIYTITKI